MALRLNKKARPLAKVRAASKKTNYMNNTNLQKNPQAGEAQTGQQLKPNCL